MRFQNIGAILGIGALLSLAPLANAQWSPFYSSGNINNGYGNGYPGYNPFNGYGAGLQNYNGYFGGFPGFGSYVNQGYSWTSPVIVAPGAFGGYSPYVSGFNPNSSYSPVLTLGWDMPPVALQSGGSAPSFYPVGPNYRGEYPDPNSEIYDAGAPNAPTLDEEQGVNPSAPKAENAGSRAANQTARPSAGVLRNRLLADGRVSVSWRGNGAGIQQITFALMDSRRRVLRQFPIVNPPAEARFRAPSNAVYGAALLQYVDGSRRLLVSPLNMKLSANKPAQTKSAKIKSSKTSVKASKTGQKTHTAQ